MNRLHTHRVAVPTTYDGVKVGDQVRTRGKGRATVKSIIRDSPRGSRTVTLMLGKPGWPAGRLSIGDPGQPITVARADTYIRFVTDDGVQVLDMTDPRSEFVPETADVLNGDGHVVRTFVVNGWATVCTRHSTIASHPTLALARAHAVDPEGWCEGHRCTCTEEGHPSGSCEEHSYLVDTLD